MESKITGFKDLRVWQKSIELVKEIYRITKHFPKDEQYGLTSQIRRSAVSIPSNIAEGVRRRSTREYKRFLNIALGSCGEVETQVIIAKELAYLDQSEESTLSELIDHISRMIVTLDKRL